MQNLKNLLARARTSEDGEAFLAVAKGTGFRVGVGARKGPRRETLVFIEVVLNPFPDRPRVSPGQLRDDGERVAWLEARGYAVACDADGTITCERVLSPARAEREIEALRKQLRS